MKRYQILWDGEPIGIVFAASGMSPSVSMVPHPSATLEAYLALSYYDEPGHSPLQDGTRLSPGQYARLLGGNGLGTYQQIDEDGIVVNDEAGDPVRPEGPLTLYIAFASTFGRGAGNPSDSTPVAAVLATSKDDVAIDAVAFADSPLGSQIAALFLKGVAGREVASQHLGGFLTKDLSLLEVLLHRLPATHPVFALVTKAEGWQDYLSLRPPTQTRRVAHR
ncbi:MAG: hypothetical protein H7288_18195 [Kineosporiaceae bacterium]|nr:hypothetical protein [Aeromicrobium sp.]